MQKQQTQSTQNLKAIAARLGLPETTLRLLREEFDSLIPVVGEGRRRRYAEEGVATLEKIVGWRREGWGNERIRAELTRQHAPREIAPRGGQVEVLQEVNARLAAQGAEIARLRVEVGALRQEIVRLVEVLRQDAPPTVQELLDGG